MEAPKSQIWGWFYSITAVRWSIQNSLTGYYRSWCLDELHNWNGNNSSHHKWTSWSLQPTSRWGGRASLWLTTSRLNMKIKIGTYYKDSTWEQSSHVSYRWSIHKWEGYSDAYMDKNNSDREKVLQRWLNDNLSLQLLFHMLSDDNLFPNALYGHDVPRTSLFGEVDSS